MSTIVLRSVKGTPLTNTEVDANFSNLNTDKIQIGGTYSSGTANGVLYLNGSKVAATGSGLTFDGTTLSVSALNATTIDLTNLEITNLKAKDGTAGMQIADSTGVVSFTSNPVISGSTANGVFYSSGSKVLTSGSALTFDGTKLGVGTASPLVGGLVTVGDGSTSAVQYLNAGATGGSIVGRISGSNTWIVGDTANVLGSGTGLINYVYGNNPTIWYNNSSEQMRLTSTGLGIGKTPAYKLDVVGVINASAANPTGINYALRTTGVTTGRSQIYLNNTSGDLVLGLEGSVGGSSYSGTAAYSSFVATTGANPFYVITNSAIRATFDSAGNVGIGTSSISNRLEISGSARLTGSLKWPGSTTTNAYINASTSDLMTFGTKDTDRMYLDSAGNLGLGVTPSAWRTSEYKAVQVGNGASFYGRVAAGDEGKAGFSANAFYDQTDNRWEYIAPNSASRYDQISGGHYWYSAASGTAGTAISFTQAMTLGTDGNLLVGTTTNTNTSKLVVNGTISQTVGGTQYLVVDQSDIGTGANEIPLNQYLGSLAYQNGDAYYNTGMTVGFRNRIINGAMVIDQRNAGASVTVNNVGIFVTDRWTCIARPTGGGVYSAQQVSDAPTGFSNSLKLTVTTVDTSLGASDYYFAWQKIEGFNTADLSFGTSSAKTVTLSFWVKSSITGQFSAFLTNQAETYSCPIAYTINTANTWEYKTVTFGGATAGTWIGATNGTGLIVGFGLANGTSLQGTSGVWAASSYYGSTGDVNWMATNGNTFQVTGVQLEKGNIATSFDVRPYGTELALCQRYYVNIVSGGASIAIGFMWNTSELGSIVNVPVTMRSTPSLVQVSGTAYYAFERSAGNQTFNSFTNIVRWAGQQGYLYTASSGTTGNVGEVRGNNAASYIAFSSEL